MKNKEESSIDSLRGNTSSPAERNRSADEHDETTSSLPRPGRTATAQIEQPALSLFSMSLMEAVVDRANIERAWKNVKANRGAPGPDGVTITKFPDWFRSHWPEIRQQLLDGTYRPDPVRRKTIDKPDGGQRLLGRYLRAGVMVEGVLQPTEVGTPQGGPRHHSWPTSCWMIWTRNWKVAACHSCAMRTTLRSSQSLNVVPSGSWPLSRVT